MFVTPRAPKKMGYLVYSLYIGFLLPDYMGLPLGQGIRSPINQPAVHGIIPDVWLLRSWAKSYDRKLETTRTKRNRNLRPNVHPGRFTAGSPTAITHEKNGKWSKNQTSIFGFWNPAVNLQGCNSFLRKPEAAAVIGGSIGAQRAKNHGGLHDLEKAPSNSLDDKTIQTLPETKSQSTWKWMVGRRSFPLRMDYFQMLC